MYENIDEFPIYNWFKCIDEKDYSYVSKNREKTNLVKCQNRFVEMYEQYIDKFGISEQLKEIIDLQNQILVLKIDKALTGDGFFQTLISLKEIELNDKVNVKQQKTNTVKVAIEKYLGFRINEKEVTVVEYYNYLQAIKEDNGRATD